MTCHWLTTTTITAADFVFTGKRDRAVERIRNKPRAHNPGRVRLQRNVCPIVKRRARLRSSNIIGWRIQARAKYRNERGPSFRQGLSMTAREMPGIRPQPYL